MKFDDAIEVIFHLEGGLADNPSDPGGLTKYGISLRSYPELGEEGIRSLTKKEAKAIYKRDYWYAVKATSLPLKTRLIVFDTAVNHGVKRAGQLMQAACNSTGLAVLEVDGVIGPKTIEAVKAIESTYLLEKMLYIRLSYYKKLKTYPIFGETWERRLFYVALKTKG